MSEEVPDDKRLVSDAASCYRRKDFEQCLSILEKLKSGKSNDTNVKINKALLSYIHKSGYSESEQYISELKRIAAIEGVNLDDCDDKILGRRNPDRSDEAHTSKDLLPNTPPHLVSKSPILINLLYNYAVVLFYQRQYAQAEKLLANCLNIPLNVESTDSKANRLRENPLDFKPLTCIDQPSSALIQAIDLTPSNDSDLCRRIILLWLEVSLKLFQVERTFALCDYWILCLNTTSVISEAPDVSSDSQPFTFSSENTNCLSHNLSSNALSVLVRIRKPIQLYYIRACLLTGRLNEAETELNLFLSEDYSKFRKESLQKNADFDENLSEVKLTSDDEDGSCLESKQSENSTYSDSMNNADYCTEMWSTGNSVFFLQAQLAYMKGHYGDAIQLLSSMPPSSHNSSAMNDWDSVIIKNNLSLIYHRTGRCTSGVLQLRHALKQIDKTIKTAVQSVGKDASRLLNYQSNCCSAVEYSELLNQIPLHVSSLLEHYELIYNYGVHLLFTHRPSEAFTTLSPLVRIYPRNPRLWFRLAECCIKLHCPHNLSLWKMESRKRCVVETFGSGSFRKLLLAYVNLEVKLKVDETLLSSPSMEFAFLALRNASLLVPKPDKIITNKSSNAVSLVKWSNKQFIPTYPSPTPLFGIGLLHFLSALHVNMSYVALCLNQPVDVLHSAVLVIDPLPQNQTTTSAPGSVKRKTYSTSLSSIAPKIHSFLCRLYYAEALTCMDRVNEATTLLKMSTNNQLDSIISSLNGVCFDMPFLFPNTDHIRGLSTSNSLNSNSNACDQINQSLLISKCPKQSIIRPVDFPANDVQSSSLINYNLAVILAIQKQYSLAKQYLDLSLPGLFISVNELDGRKWHINDFSDESKFFINNSKLLPTSVILLRIYLAIHLNDQKQAIELIRENFGQFAIANRLNSISIYNDELMSEVSIPHDNVDSSISARSLSSTLIDLQQLMKTQQSNLTTGISQIQSPSSSSSFQQQLNHFNIGKTNHISNNNTNQSNNVWTPCQQFRQSQAQQSQSIYYSPLLQTQSTLSNYEYANYWDSSTPSTTGIITANNENDWPPL
ncbi:CCR4-NOT transcription complex subunit 10 isoform 2 [Schistosoma japonicum]|uniref:CCR4-NOT transcription complex subunit 10 n=1 Tax=Schistosoma japonicum TaxID=6182 RepID=A0A4Z2DQV7_SCHJA|nr:CCR4-NOT transcription complex subunit 10 isoform 2 [Schistosoma japonicum]